MEATMFPRLFIALAMITSCKTDKASPTQWSVVEPPPMMSGRKTATDAAPDPAANMVIPDKYKSQPPSPGPNEEPEPTPGEPSIYPNSIPAHTLLDYYAGLAGLVSELTEPHHASLVECKSRFLTRTGPLDTRLEWTASLRIIGDGTWARVADVQMRSDAWPPMFNDQDKACVIKYLMASPIQSSDVVDAAVDYPVCFIPTKE